MLQINANSCLPLAYQPTTGSRGHRIGGLSPVAPAHPDAFQKYFGTLEFEDGMALSIFYSFDISGVDEAPDTISHNNQLLRASSLIHGVWHRSSDRGRAGSIASEVSCHAVFAGAERPDQESDEVGGYIPFQGAKLGGEPFVENIPRCGEAFDEAARLGFRQLAQFETPNPLLQPYIEGFPWDPGWLHVLVRESSGRMPDLAFVVQQ